MKRWESVAAARELRRIARWAAEKQDPVERLRYLRERMSKVPISFLWRQPRPWKRIVTAVAATLVLVAAALLWRRI